MRRDASPFSAVVHSLYILIDRLWQNFVVESQLTLSITPLPPTARRPLTARKFSLYATLVHHPQHFIFISWSLIFSLYCTQYAELHPSTVPRVQLIRREFASLRFLN